MSKHKILFPSERDENVMLNAVALQNNLLKISIEDYGCDHTYNVQEIFIDKQTAVKLTRVLKAEISKMNNHE